MANYSPTLNLYLPSRNDSDIPVDTSLTDNFNKIDQNASSVTSQLAEKANQSDLDTTNTNVSSNTTDISNLKTNKADISYVDTKTSSLASGSPKGVYATLSALQTAFPSGNTNIYVVTADGNWYYWNGSTWTSGGVYQSSVIKQGSITPSKTSFIVEGQNKFDLSKNTMTDGYYIQSGSLIANVSYQTTSPIYLEPSTQYRLSKATWGSATTNARGSMFDANDTFIGAWDNLTQTTPSNFAYVRFTVYKVSVTINDLMIVEGTTVPSSFIPYSLTLDSEISVPSAENTFHYPLYVKRTGNSITVASKYNATNDLQVTIKPVGQSLLPQFASLDLKPNSTNSVVNDFTNVTNIVTIGTDLVGPYKVLAKNNIDGDNPSADDFCGGWHGYNGDQTGAKTANNHQLDLIVDGVKNNSDGVYGGSEVKVIVNNGIYASNTKKADGTGREVLQEYVTYTFKSNGEIQVENRIEISEDVSLHTYYGMQMTMDSYFSNKFLFVGDNLQPKWISPASQDLSGGNKTQSYCYKMLLKNNSNYFEAELEKFSMGNRQYISSTDSVAFSTSYNKAYFRLVDWCDFSQGQVLNWRGHYKWYYQE